MGAFIAGTGAEGAAALFTMRPATPRPG
jgi:hypothetical protein